LISRPPALNKNTKIDGTPPDFLQPPISPSKEFEDDFAFMDAAKQHDLFDLEVLTEESRKVQCYVIHQSNKIHLIQNSYTDPRKSTKE
jgi:hypothetical protein